MKHQRLAFAVLGVLVGVLPAAGAEAAGAGPDQGWGVLSELADSKFVWNSGRARGSDASELTFHEFRWRGEVLTQTQCSYWPLRSMKAVCGTHLIEKLPDGSLVLKANGGKPHFQGTVAPDGSVEFVNRTLIGKVVTAFVARPDGAVELMHYNRVDGESRSPLLPVDARREAEIMEDMETIFAAAQAQKREEAERRYAAFMGVMEGMNAVLSRELKVATANEAQSRASLDETIIQSGQLARVQSARTAGGDTHANSAVAHDAPSQPQPRVSAPGARATTGAPATDRPDLNSTQDGPWFAYCVALKPGAYMDAPGALFLSEISTINSLAEYNNGSFAEAFGAAVSAKYGTSVSASCNVLRNRADAQRRLQEQRDSFGLTAYRKVETGIPAKR